MIDETEATGNRAVIESTVTTRSFPCRSIVIVSSTTCGSPLTVSWPVERFSVARNVSRVEGKVTE